MLSQRELFRFAEIPSEAFEEAFAFHAAVAAVDPHIWLRTRVEIQGYAEHGSLFGVRKESDFGGRAFLGLPVDSEKNHPGKLVAVAYAMRDKTLPRLEIGGVSVDESVRGIGLGTVLMRFALMHTMVFDDPWRDHLTVVAHVREDNAEPKDLLRLLGFELCGPVEVPKDIAPSTWKTNEQGKIIGDEFRFTLDGLRKLARWLEEDFETLRKSGFRLDFGPFTIQQIIGSLQQIVTTSEDSTE
jgi:ribosomal protein S18 acetylase RimI-like enzyme